MEDKGQKNKNVQKIWSEGKHILLATANLSKEQKEEVENVFLCIFHNKKQNKYFEAIKLEIN